MRPLVRVGVVAVALIPAGATAAPAQVEDNVARIREYYRVNNARDTVRLRTFYADSVHFADPTYGLDLHRAQEVVRLYADNFVLVDEHRWTIADMFGTGPFVVVKGTYHSALDGEKVGHPGIRAGADVPFYTVFRLRDGRVELQVDYFAYDVWDGRNPQVPIPGRRAHEPRETLTRVADAWVRRLRAVPDSIDALMALYAPDVDFADPTFQLGLHNRDTFRAEILRYARATAATAPEMIILDRFLSGAFIALWGRYTEQIRAEEPDRRIGMRYLTVLELANGKIVRHRDYYEAEPYRAAKRAG